MLNEPEPATARRIYICSIEADQDIQDAVARHLESRGFKCEGSRRSLRAGEHSITSQIQAVRNSRCYVLILSKASATSSGLTSEIQLAHGLEKPVFVIEIEPINPNPYLQFLLRDSPFIRAYAPKGGTEAEPLQMALEQLTKALLQHEPDIEIPLVEAKAEAEPIPKFQIRPITPVQPEAEKPPDKQPPPPGSYAGPAPTPMAPAPPKRKPKPKPDPKPKTHTKQVPGGRADNVHFSVSAPATVAPASAFLVTVWAHLAGQRDEMIRRAEQAGPNQKLSYQTRGPTPLNRGITLTVTLQIADWVVEREFDTIYWDGEIGNAIFPVKTPATAPLQPTSTHGTATIHANGFPFITVDFEITLAQTTAEPGELKTIETRFRRAFASYSSKDVKEVAARIQGIQKGIPGIDIFWDRHSLKSGQNWEEIVTQEVQTRDVFYLFWSLAASQSKEVEKEWRLALATRGLAYIDPIPLVSPQQVPPPAELGSELHFNDWILAYTLTQHQTRPWWKRLLGID